MSVRRLDEALSVVPYKSDSNTDIATLIRYVVEYTPDYEDEQDMLRRVVTVFAANNITELRKVKQFQKLLTDGGTFSRVVMDLVCSRGSL